LFPGVCQRHELRANFHCSGVSVFLNFSKKLRCLLGHAREILGAVDLVATFFWHAANS